MVTTILPKPCRLNNFHIIQAIKVKFGMYDDLLSRDGEVARTSLFELPDIHTNLVEICGKYYYFSKSVDII